jgi:hypothetical protein
MLLPVDLGFPRFASAEGGFVKAEGQGMQTGNRKIFEDVENAAGVNEFCLNLWKSFLEVAQAEGALVIGEFNNGDGCVWVT